jgi:putative tryptophan/tyrosine transport system substrate-binding protein
MKRRQFITGLASAVVGRALPAQAQQPKRLPVVGLVGSTGPVVDMHGSNPTSPPIRGFVQQLRELDWIDGQNIFIERRSAEGGPKRASTIFAELIAREVDVIAVTGALFLQEAAQRATRTIPTVAHFAEDPVAAGLIASLARPAGNLTGVTLFTGPEFHSKQLQLLQELDRRISRIAFLATRKTLEEYRGIPRPLGATVLPVEVDLAEHFQTAFTMIVREHADAVMVGGGPLYYNNGLRVVAFAAERRLPTIYSFRELAAADGLMAYGASAVGNFRQMARLVDKILRGAKPADLPVEQPTTFELVINLKTAKALGLEVTPTLVARADEVIE